MRWVKPDARRFAARSEQEAKASGGLAWLGSRLFLIALKYFKNIVTLFFKHLALFLVYFTFCSLTGACAILV